MSQIYLPMHSATDWPVLVAFVKLTPNKISETNIIYHTENGEREFRNYFNFVPPTNILQAPLTTKKFNPITANLQPGIGEGCNASQPQPDFDCISKSQVTKTAHQVMRESLITSFVKVLRFTSMTFVLLPQIQGKVYFFLGDKRLHFLSCLISEARSLKRKKPKCLKSYEVVVSWWWSDTCNTYINTYTALIIVHIQWEENLHKKEWGNRSQNEQSLLFLTCFTYSNLLGNEW